MMDRYEAFDEFFYIELAHIMDTKKEFKNVENPLRFSAPKTAGLYLVGNTAFNPFTGEEFYFVKVGSSSNLYKRMGAYRSTNPAVFHIDFYEKDRWAKGMNESACHFVCQEISMGRVERTSEWFRVDRETYFEICATGFTYFEEKIHKFLTTGSMF